MQEVQRGGTTLHRKDSEERGSVCGRHRPDPLGPIGTNPWENGANARGQCGRTHAFAYAS